MVGFSVWCRLLDPFVPFLSTCHSCSKSYEPSLIRERFLSRISRSVVQGEEDEEISRSYCGLLISIQDIWFDGFYPSNFLFSLFCLFWSSIGFVKSCRAIVHGKRLCSAKGAVLLCFCCSLCHRAVIHHLCSWFQVAFWFVLGISVG